MLQISKPYWNHQTTWVFILCNFLDTECAHNFCLKVINTHKVWFDFSPAFGYRWTNLGELWQCSVQQFFFPRVFFQSNPPAAISVFKRLNGTSVLWNTFGHNITPRLAAGAWAAFYLLHYSSVNPFTAGSSTGTPEINSLCVKRWIDKVYCTVPAWNKKYSQLFWTIQCIPVTVRVLHDNYSFILVVTQKMWLPDSFLFLQSCALKHTFQIAPFLVIASCLKINFKDWSLIPGCCYHLLVVFCSISTWYNFL